MALIKCTECGKEISDQAITCVNCGCPVSKMKTSGETPGQSALNQDIGELFGEFFGNGAARPAAPVPVKTVPKEMPEVKGIHAGLFPGIVKECINKLCGVAGLAGYGAAFYMVTQLLLGNFSPENLLLAVGGITLGILCAKVNAWIEFLEVRHFLRKSDYEDSIRNDSADRINTFRAYGLCPGKPMRRYLRKLNPSATEVLDSLVAKAKADRRKEKLSYIPYILALMVAFYLIPRLLLPVYYDENVTIALAHIAAFLANLVYTKKRGGKLWLMVCTAVLFAPTIFSYYYEELWYHIAICFGAAVLGAFIGCRLPAKKSA